MIFFIKSITFCALTKIEEMMHVGTPRVEYFKQWTVSVKIFIARQHTDARY